MIVYRYLSGCLFPRISRILECGGGLLENRILAGVPLGQHPLLLELGELPAVVDTREHLPHQDERQADGHDGADDPEDDAHDVHHHGALLGLLHPHLQLPSLVLVAVHEGEPAVVIVNEGAEPLVILHEVLRLLHDLRLEGAEAALVHAPLVLLAHELAGAEHLALDTRLELLALAGAGGAVLAVLAAVLTLLRLLALALPALAGPVARAELVDVLAVGRDAGLVAGAALAGGVALHVPLGVALALPAHTLAVVRPRAQLAVVAVAAEVVALAVVSVHALVHVVPGVTLALAADAVAAVVAEGGGGVVGSAAGLQVAAEGEILGGALALAPEEVRRTLADAALVGADPVAQRAALLVAGVAGPLAVALAQHLQVHDHTLVDAHGVDLEGLPPLPRVLGALDHLDLGGEGDLGADLEAGALVGLPRRPVPETVGLVGDPDGARGVVLHLDGAGDGLVLRLHQLHDVARVVAEPPGGGALHRVGA